MKTCTRCEAEKPRADFYVRQASTDGLQPICKDCDRRTRRERYYRNHRRELDLRSAYQRTPHGYERSLAANRRWRRRNPRKARAHSAVAYAISTGKLVRQACERCGSDSGEAHHEDYSRPLDVMWLCKTCHEKRHREIEMKERSNIPFARLPSWPFI